MRYFIGNISGAKPQPMHNVPSQELSDEEALQEIQKTVQNTLQPGIDEMNRKLADFAEKEKRIKADIAELKAAQGMTANSGRDQIGGYHDTLPA
ncbi:hypothetical protein RSO41_14090 [Halomonas sp. I1]|uniref:hypothetical protein n=1 Tax=Halomonas sp. I1 TaxID=393536 RepID=UPI0028DE2783|nr:hypothetical protein [Halomonas sp. I1]MDT8895784.1 hypothetical protein [Halomonas sp. I1]